MTVLSVSAGLLLVFVFDIRCLLDRLAERDLGLFNLDCDIVFVLEHRLNDLQMEISHAVNQRLAVRGVVDRAESGIFCRNLRHCLRDLVDISLVDGTVTQIRIRDGKIHLRVHNRRCLCRQRIAGCDIAELRQSTEISRMQLRNLRRLVALQNIKLAAAQFRICPAVIKKIISL